MNILGFSGLPNSAAFLAHNFPSIPARIRRMSEAFDAAAALVTTQGIVAAAAEERFTGKKTTGAFPLAALEYCLQAANLKPRDIDLLAHGWSHHPFAPYFLEVSPLSHQQYQDVFSREAHLQTLASYFPSEDWEAKLVEVPHHLAHAASTFYLSGFEEALILVADARAEMHSMLVGLGTQQKMNILQQYPALHSIGTLYSLITYFLGFKPNSDEYKVMGLAAYGNPRRFIRQFQELLVFREAGQYSIPLLAANVTDEEKVSFAGSRELLAEWFGPPRDPASPLTQEHKDMAAALQQVLQAVLHHVLQYYKQKTGMQKLCMAGGVALNCTANGFLRRSRLFKQIFIQPAAGDDGTALGAALYIHQHHNPESSWQTSQEHMPLPLWGPEYSEEEITRAIDLLARGCQITYYPQIDELVRVVASHLASGCVVAWFQGRMEFGPRALGNRSILADPRRSAMRDHLNTLIKKREDFRPFAPSVPIEDAGTYFEVDEHNLSADAYMLFLVRVRPYYRALLPAITHIDGTTRIQTVNREAHPLYWSLLKSFEQQCGVPVLLNTSFNLRDQPIIRSPEEAISTFRSSELDYLALGHYLISQYPKMDT